MANWHGYLLIRDIPNGWDNNLLWSEMHTLGKQDSGQPAENNHMRVSLNGLSAIIEALFDEGELTNDERLTQLEEFELELQRSQYETSKKRALNFMKKR